MSMPAPPIVKTLATLLVGSFAVSVVCAFVVFAVLRVVTGISIQRPGYLSVKRISFEPTDGVKLEVRKLGILIHWPTFTQPTWVSIVFQEPRVILDLRQRDGVPEENGSNGGGGGDGRGKGLRIRGETSRGSRKVEGGGGGGEDAKAEESTPTRADTEEKIRKLKNILKKAHKWIKWIRPVDIVITNAVITIAEVGSIQVGSLTLMVDTRRGTANRNPMFDHTDLKEGQRPIEWIMATKSILFITGKKDPIELLDHSIVHIYGVVEDGVDGLRDLGIAFKFGQVTVPCDELLAYAERLKTLRTDGKRRDKPMVAAMDTLIEEMAVSGSRTQRVTEAVMENREILNSLLKGVKEIQFAIGYLVVSKEIPNIQPLGQPLVVSLGLKELGMDIHQLDQKSPAHRMYFSPNDIAHQALLAAIAITVSLNDGVRQDKILYIPILTMTSRTTLFCKTMQIMEALESDRNANILSANVVVTSPSIDLKPRHLPLIVAFMQSRPKRKSKPSGGRTHIISRLLPKASVKLSIQEPVMRIVLPFADLGVQDMDMLISSMSSISVDMEASHDAEGQSRYSLDAALRITSHNLYYRAACGMHHDLLQTETFDLKSQLNASPEVQVICTAYVSSFSLKLARPEIVSGLKQMMSQFHGDYNPDKLRHPESSGTRQKFLRRFPLWLEQFKLECNDFSIEVAGVDEEISEFTRGMALQMDSLTIDYKCKRGDSSYHPTPRRRATSRTLSTMSKDDSQKPKPTRPTVSSKDVTDDRKLSLHLRGLDTFMVDGPDSWEPDPFFQIPHFDLAFATSNDAEGPVLHISSFAKSFSLNYSMYRHYSVIVAAQVLRESFGGMAKAASVNAQSTKRVADNELHTQRWSDKETIESQECEEDVEFVSVDVKLQYVKIKASMPDDPPMMLEIHQLDTGRHRWGFPFLKTKHCRVYAESPKVKSCWARLISLRHFRLDLREVKRRSEEKVTDEKSIDLSADAIRIAIPHQLTLYKVTDNVLNTVKACQQMHHRFKTGTNEYILEKKPESAKIVPKVFLKTKALLLELEDDPFEAKLGLIYRVGLTEQKKRLARESAFEAKVKKMEEQERRKSGETSRTTAAAPTESHRFRGRARTWRQESTLASSLRPKSRQQSAATPLGGKNMRYDPESAAGPSGNASVSIDDAWERLQELSSVAWIKRIRSAKEQQRVRMGEAREMFWGHDDLLTDTAETETTLGLPMVPSLMAAFFNDVTIGVDKPSFPLSELPKFLHRVGKGLPEDTLFALLVPLSTKLSFSEGRVLLRDYPLPFIHVPHPRVGQRDHAWTLQADFVLAEEFRGSESMRHAKVNIVPPVGDDGVLRGGFAIDVRRTVSPVKSYSDIKVSINTSYATRICWCTAYQPAIQDMMMVFETFTKPHVDPSERTGFWDKIRLILHSQISLVWEGDGDVHLALKGSRDPYSLVGDGAGFVMCWRGDVRWDLNVYEDPRKVIQVDSEEFVLAIPDFTNHVSEDIDIGALPETRSIASTSSYDNFAQFKKVIMKLSGRVRWLVGLMFEQETSFEEDWKLRSRSFEFKPHYEVTLKAPQYAKALPGKVYDAFRGFRSHHLHLSLAIVSPIEKDWSPANSSSPTSYNTIHLTPKFSTHFFAWWSLFSGVMSLPIRQGPLWPGPEKSNKKFGRHLATVKYKLCLSPLFISHIYKYHDKNDNGNDIVAATGLKAKLDTFLLDIHMRREESVVIPGSTSMKINQAELDFHSADIRAVHAVMPRETLEELMGHGADGPYCMSDTIRYTGDLSQFTVTDSDYTWIDMDDFVELDWEMPKGKTPKTKIMPLAYAPRFTYFRQTDHSGEISPLSPFGNEATHDCIMSLNNDPREIQCALVQARLERVNEQMSMNQEAIESLALHTKLNPDDLDLKTESDRLIQQSSVIFNMRQFLQTMLRKISSKLDDGKRGNGHQDYENYADSDSESEMLRMDTTPFADYASDFDNRFIVHNMQAKWSNPLKNIILKYIHQVGQRRGFIYYMSRRAIKFILDIIEEQKNSSQPATSRRTEFKTPGPCNMDQPNDNATLESRIQQLLNDDIKVVMADERPFQTTGLDEAATGLARDDLGGDVAEEYIPQNSFHVRLIAPQIQMQSDKNKGAAVLVAAQGMQLKIVSIMDRDRIGDEVSGLVQRRFALNLDNTQFFVSHHQDFASQSMSLHSENRYGAPGGSSWPPWVPLESMFDFRQTPVGFSRVVERTSATLRYDKHNSLRLKYSDQVSGIEAGKSGTKAGPLETERRVDHVWVDFPRVEASCDSNQYFAVYIIIMDLLLYSEPAQKVRSEKLEKIMLASDFSDLTGAPEMVECLQNRIHQLSEIKSHFMLNTQNLDLEGWKGKFGVEEDLASCEEELFFMMKAITTAQRKYEDRSAQSSGMVRWYITASEIIWHLLRDKSDPLMDVMLQKAAFERVDNADGSNLNTFEVEMLRGFNLLPDAIYPEMIAPFVDHRAMPEVRRTKVLRVYWNMLEAIAGIPVMDHFEVNLIPLKIQLEREIGDKIFEYIFPEAGKGDGETDSGFSPFLVHSMKPLPDRAEGSESDNEIVRIVETHPRNDDSSSTKSSISGHGGLRLRSTVSMTNDPQRPSTSYSDMTRPKTSSAASFFGYGGGSSPLTRKASADNLSMISRRSAEGHAPSLYVPEKGKKMQLFSRTPTTNERLEQRSDELSQMMSRASNYMTLAYVKIPSVVLCLSYKGRGDKNIEDIHELVFKMPMLEYRNRTWSNLDLAMRLKKDIIRALISHTGAIIQNKFTHHRPEKPQGNLLRIMANNGSLGTQSSRPSTAYDNSQDLSDAFHPTRPATAIPSRSAPSIFRSDSLSMSGLSLYGGSSPSSRTVTDNASISGDSESGGFANALGRHLTSLTHHSNSRRNSHSKDDDSEESIKKKSRLLLGKKVFSGL